MNSIRPLATVAILAVIGVGLYMVINTKEPIPPDEAANALLEIPQIEDELRGLIEEGTTSPYEGSTPIYADAAPPYADATSVPPFTPGELSDPPAWSPPPADSLPESPIEADSAAVGQLPQNRAASPTAGTPMPTSMAPPLPAGPGRGSPGVAKDPFSSQIEQQVHGGVTPQELNNPYAIGASTGDESWGDIPSAGSAEGLANPTPYASETPASASPFAVVKEAISQLLRERNLSQALLMLSEYYGDPQLTAAETDELDALLGQLAGTVIYSREHELEPAYQVQPGETLQDIAARFQVTPQLLAKINALADPMHVAPGTELKVVRGPFHAVYEERGIRLVLDGRYAGRFSASGAAAWPTEGWTVQQKVPAAHAGGAPSGGGKQILLSAANPAGTGATAAILTGSPEPGETNPAVYVSAQDMDDLYDILTVGSRVVIRR